MKNRKFSCVVYMLVGLIMCLVLLKSRRHGNSIPFYVYLPFHNIYIYINAECDFLGSHKHFVILIVLREQDTKKSYIKFSMVDIVIVRDCSLPVGQGSKNLMKHPCPEKSQSTCPSSSRSVWDAIILRLKAPITKLLCPVKHLTCSYAWLKKEIVFEATFVVFHHDYIAYYIAYWK